MPTAKADSQVTDVEAIESLVGDDSTLLVDLLAYRAADVRALLPGMGSVGSAVIISTGASPSIRMAATSTGMSRPGSPPR